MAAVGVLLASFVLLAGWMAYRRFTAEAGAGRSGWPGGRSAIRFTAGETASNPVHHTAQIGAVNASVADRLWRLAFGAPAQTAPPARPHLRIRELICAKLQVDALDPEYFPRRPTLMPQLLKALDDPRAESAKTVAHHCARSGADRRCAAAGQFESVPDVGGADRDHSAGHRDLRRRCAARHPGGRHAAACVPRQPYEFPSPAAHALGPHRTGGARRRTVCGEDAPAGSLRGAAGGVAECPGALGRVWSDDGCIRRRCAPDAGSRACASS